MLGRLTLVATALMLSAPVLMAQAGPARPSDRATPAPGTGVGGTTHRATEQKDEFDRPAAPMLVILPTAGDSWFNPGGRFTPIG